MSLMKALAKVAIGMAIAKGAGSVMGGNKGASGGLFGGGQAARGGSTSMLGGLLGGGSGSGGGIGGMLESLSGKGGSGGGIGSVLGGLAGGAGLGGMLGSLTGAAQGSQEPQGSFGEVLNSQFDENPDPAKQPSADQEAAAGIMLSAMLQAAKSDGKFDNAEQAKLMEHLGDIGPDERQFIHDEMQKPVDVQGLCRQVPKGLEDQVYAMSVMGIDLDSQAEAQYLDQLANGLGIGKEQVNGVHDEMGVPRIYS